MRSEAFMQIASGVMTALSHCSAPCVRWIPDARGATQILPISTAWAQQLVAPTPETVGSARGRDWGGYNLVYGFETGYRFRSVGGDLGRYRSDVNLGEGPGLLASSFLLSSKDGRGRLVDLITLNTSGLGNNPYQFSSLRAEKNALYRYDFTWRLTNYFNPALTISDGQHFLGTQRKLQDHDLTLWPQSRLKFVLGYSRNLQTGPALSTLQLFNVLGDEFPLLTDIRRGRNEYRAGGETQFLGLKLTALRGWEDFKEDTRFPSPFGPGNNPADLTTLASLRRSEPYHGTSGYWQVGLLSENRKHFALNGRFSYVSGRRAFVLDEVAEGTDRFGAAASRQVITFGNARRPLLASNFNISVFATTRLTVSNQTTFNQLKIDGDSFLRQVDNSTLATDLINFELLGIRTITNTTTALYQATSRIGIVAGYQFTDRRIRSTQKVDGDPRYPGSVEQTNQLHAGIFGLRLRPAKSLTVNLDGEVGRADRPLYPISERNYHQLGARVQYKWKTVTAGASARSSYNFNTVPLSAYSSLARNYSVFGSWSGYRSLTLNGSYTKLHLNTVGGVAFFEDANFMQGQFSRYFSSLHAANLGVRFSVLRRADLDLGYSHVQDTAHDRAPNVAASAATEAAFRAAQAFPLTFQSPLARLSVRIGPKLRWNLGYQFFGYHEEAAPRAGYHAHTGYSSLLWTF